MPVELPLSDLQAGIWYAHQLHPESAQFHGVTGVRIRSRVDVDALSRAWDALLTRHDALRTTFHSNNGEIVQRVNAKVHSTLDLQELGECSEDELRRRVNNEYKRPFDLSREMARLALLRRGPDDQVLVLTAHHIGFDLDAADVIEVELPKLYSAFRNGESLALEPPKASYADFVRAEANVLAGARGRELREFWQKTLSDAPAALELPTDRPRSRVRRGRGGSLAFTVEAPIVRALRAISPSSSFFRTMLSAYYVFMFRLTGQSDLVVATPSTARVPPFEDVVGDFVNMLVLRAHLSRGQSFKALLGQVREVVTAASSHREYPFMRIVQDLRLAGDASRTPIYQTSFALVRQQRVKSMSGYNIEGAPCRADMGELSGDPYYVPQQEGQLDLAIWGAEIDGTLYAEIKYDTDLFERATVARMAENFRTLLGSIARDPDCALGDLDLLSAAERETVLVDFNRTDAPYPNAVTLHGLIEQQARRTPSVIAIRSEERSLTYAELDARANRLARGLRARGVGRGDFVGIGLERSAELSVALLATLKAGAAYVPIDPDYPADRVRFMTEDSGVRLILTTTALRARFAESAPVLALDQLDVSSESDAPTDSSAGALDVAYMIYTSGSTGQPKGAMNTHRAICNRLAWMQSAFPLDDSDRVLQKTPISFDVSVWELFWPIMVGATLVMARPGGHRDPGYLARTIMRARITTLHFVPSMLRAFLEEPLVAECASVRRVICSGEALSWDLHKTFFERCGAELHNLYGPTEAAVDVSWWPCERDSSRSLVPIGRPIQNLRLYVLDSSLRPVPIGVVGELFIGGVGVGLGYKGRASLTASKFIPDEFCGLSGARLYRTGDLARQLSTGEIDFLGRTDHQVKVRGFRIELGEIEATLLAHDSVKDCVVVATEDGLEKQLIAYVVTSADPSSLRDFLSSRLPAHEVPAHFERLDTIPLGPNGKVDRCALPLVGCAQTARRAFYVAPSTERERTLAEIWAGVLKLDRVGIDESFFDLGGDSMRSISIVALARQRGIALSLVALFHNPTIRRLAQTPDEEQVERAPLAAFDLISPEDRARLPAGVVDAYPVTMLQARMLERSRRHAALAMYHDVFEYRVSAPLREDALRAAIADLISAHPVLRTSFDLDAFSVPMQIVHPRAHAPLELASSHDERTRGHDWSTPPLLRFIAHAESERTFALTLSFHHAVLDGWSVATLLVELLTRYTSRMGGAVAPIAEAAPDGFREFVALELEARRSPPAKRFWSEILVNRPTPRLPRTSAQSRAILESNLVRDELPAGLLARLRQVARSLDVPLKSVLLAAHVKAIAEVTNVTDVLTGVIAGGRTEASGAALGLFTNAVWHRQRVCGDFATLARDAFEIEKQWLPFRRYPSASLDDDDPLFEFVFNYLDFHLLRGAVQITPERIFEQQDFTLIVNAFVDAKQQLTLDSNFNPDLIARSTAEAFNARVVATLQEVSKPN